MYIGAILTLYRRHKKTCKVHKTKLAARAKRYYADCECPIWIYGHTDTESFPRRSTGLTDMVAAEAFRLSQMKKSKDPVLHGPRIEDCVDRFLASRKHKLGDRTAGSYRLLLGRLTTYCAKRGVQLMRELSVDLLEDFKVEGLPDLADTTKGITVAKLRCFLREAFRRDWILLHLAEKVTRHDAVYEEKEPYSDKEVDLILTESLKLNGGREGYASAPSTFRLLLELMLETGMRVGDAIRFDPSAAKKGDSLWIYSYVQQKHKRSTKDKPIESYLTDHLKRAIDKCTWMSPAQPFWFGPRGDHYSDTKCTT
jgi:integrase